MTNSSHKITAKIVEVAITAAGNPEKAVGAQRFFKTGRGQYGEGDVFLGVNNPTVRQIAKEYRELPITEAVKLLKNPYHEIRLCALLILVEHYRKGDKPLRERILEIYLKNTLYINNWDLVDLSAPGIVGEAALTPQSDMLDFLAGSTYLWNQRIAMVSTLTLIRHGEFAVTLRLAERFMSHPHDLMHKAAGWMLREVGKRNRAILTKFLLKHKHVMPRTMLRYAIEHYPEEQRQEFLKK
jgi:3-methyladenine DNA glycosylase AlkD